jgi:hypothetical protein
MGIQHQTASLEGSVVDLEANTFLVEDEVDHDALPRESRGVSDGQNGLSLQGSEDGGKEFGCGFTDE